MIYIIAGVLIMLIGLFLFAGFESGWDWEEMREFALVGLAVITVCGSVFGGICLLIYGIDQVAS